MLLENGPGLDVNYQLGKYFGTMHKKPLEILPLINFDLLEHNVCLIHYYNSNSNISLHDSIEVMNYSN